LFFVSLAPHFSQLMVLDSWVSRGQQTLHQCSSCHCLNWPADNEVGRFDVFVSDGCSAIDSVGTSSVPHARQLAGKIIVTNFRAA
jgi:hypothetical protein